LELLAGRRDAARGRFEACARLDPLEFSPLLATKSVEAAYLAGWLHALDGDREEARAWWSAGLEHARRACAGDWREVIGDPERPFTFALRELGQVLDQAARCAAGLNALACWDSAPGRLAELLMYDSRIDRERAHDLAAEARVRDAVALATADQARQLATVVSDANELRGQIHDAHARLSHVRNLLADRSPRGLRRVVICGANERTRGLWEALASRPTVDVVAFVDDDASRHGRRRLGVPVHGSDWLRGGDWDRLAVLRSDASAWHARLVPLALDDAAWLEFADGDAGALQERAARLFPDALAPALQSRPTAAGARLGVFGTGSGAMKVWEALADVETADIVWFADNNAAQQGRDLVGVRVIAPADIACAEYDAVVIGSMARASIREQLLELGVAPGRIMTPDVVGPIENIRRQVLAHLLELPARGPARAGRGQGRRLEPVDREVA